MNENMEVSIFGKMHFLTFFHQKLKDVLPSENQNLES